MTGEEIRTGLSALAIALSALALSKDYWLRPRLSLEHQPLDDARRNRPSDPDRLDTVDLGDECFVRLRVTNSTLVNSAEDTEVLVVGFRPATRGLALDARPLIWTSLSAKRLEPVTRATTPPGITRHVDLLRVFRTDTGIEGELLVHPPPKSNIHRLCKPMTIAIELAVVARDTNARFFGGFLRFDPAHGPLLSDCVSLTRLRRIRSVGDLD